MENHRPFRDFRYDFAKSDGSRLSVMINGAPVHDEDGRFLGYRGTGSDITEQTLAEESRDDALQKAQAANNAKSEFLATMSHEFRTPLNAILGFSDMLRGRYQVQVQSEKYREYAEAIHGSGEHMLELVNDILDISAIEAGQRPVVKTSIDVTGLIAACVEEIDATAGEKGVSVKIATPDDLPSLYADERSIRQIVLNLLSNAIKFTPYQGTISLSIGVDGPIMKLAVRDTGIGIPAELLPSVVEPFSQSNSNPHTAQEGFGLGLSIVKSLVDALGGDLTIESEVGVGTVVTVALEAPPLDIVPDRAILQSNAD